MNMARVLNMLVLTVVVAFHSFHVVRATACQRAQTEWMQRDAKAQRLLSEEKLTYEDVRDAYMPKCDIDGNYATKQCFMNSYCWCSDPHGKMLDGTFQKGSAEKLDCTKCIVGNNSYKSGDYFKIPETCQSCQCLNREVVCQTYKYFCSNKTKLNAQGIMELKITILIVIYYQHETRKHNNPVTIVKEEDLAKVPLDVALAYRTQRLHWKFNKFDKNKDDQLNKQYEFSHFMSEIQHFVQSRKVFNMIFTLIDKDSDKLISKQEWVDFFDKIIITPDPEGSGSATIDDEESTEASGDIPHAITTRSVKASRSFPEVMKEFVRKLRKQQRISHSEDKYF